MAYNSAEPQNLLYLYDLPKKETTSVQLINLLKEKANLGPSDISGPPQIFRNPSKMFYSAMIKFNNAEKLKIAAEKMRFFELNGKPCRGLKYMRDLLGSQRAKMAVHNLMAKKLPASVKTTQDLEEMFKDQGKIVSSKLSIDENYASRNYGFVTFEEKDVVDSVIKKMAVPEGVQLEHYKPRDNREMRKVFNNIYAKNFPPEHSEEDIKKMF